MPYRARTKHADNTDCEGETDDTCELQRVSPKWLVYTLKRINPRQRSVVEELGFGHLFLLQVDSVPGS